MVKILGGVFKCTANVCSLKRNSFLGNNNINDQRQHSAKIVSLSQVISSLQIRLVNDIKQLLLEYPRLHRFRLGQIIHPDGCL